MKSIGLLAIAAVILVLAFTTLAAAQPRFQTFFLAVGNSNYVKPADSGLHSFGDLSGANSSARTVAEILSRNGANAGITLTSTSGHYVGKADFDHALSDLISRLRAAHPQNPFLIIYFVGHGISEGVAWSHFSVPGNFVYGSPLDRLDAEELARHTVHAASLADELDRTGIPYLVLLDTCYEGQPASFVSPVLTSNAITSLQQVAGILRFANEFHGPNPVIFSAEPGREVPLAPDPRSPDQASLGPIGRRLLLLFTRIAASGESMSLSAVVSQLTSAGLDQATSAPITHSTAPKVDAILLAPSSNAASIDSRTGTATSQDLCCAGSSLLPESSPPAPGPTTPQAQMRRLQGALSLRGPMGEFISGGVRISLPAGTPVTVSEPDQRTVELKFSTHDDWELDLAAPEGSELKPGTYRGAVRYPFQEGNEPGLSLSGAGRGCNDLKGEFTLTRLKRDQQGNIADLAATFTQRCDQNRAAVSGSVAVMGR